MVIKVFRKTGEYRDANGDWDGDYGYYEEVVVDSDTKKSALVEIMVDCALEKEVTERERELCIKVVKKIVTENDLLDELCENYENELKEYIWEI